MNVPRSPSQLFPSWQHCHYERLTAEVELLRRENRSLRLAMDSWRDGKKQAFLHLDGLLRTIALLPSNADEQSSPVDCATAASPLSPASTDKLYRLYESCEAHGPRGDAEGQEANMPRAEIGTESANLLNARIARLRHARRVRSETFCNNAATGLTDEKLAADCCDISASAETRAAAAAESTGV